MAEHDQIKFKKIAILNSNNLITFSFKTVEINVWSAPESVSDIGDKFTSVSSVKSETPMIKSLAT